MGGRIVCFGELLLRMAAPDGERLLQTGTLHVHAGGAEANVAVSLAHFGHQAKLVTILPANSLGRAALSEVRKEGVDVSSIIHGPGQMGLYFISFGAVVRPSRVTYHREGSSFSKADAEVIDWGPIYKDADWLHISGITPAVSGNATQAVLRAVDAALDAGVKVSFDGNYRSQLWDSWGGDGTKVIRELLSKTTIGFINERDIGLILGEKFTDRTVAFERAFNEFPNLEYMSATTRETLTMDHHRITAEIVSRKGRWFSKSYNAAGIVDRIGGGDAFAAGILHGILSGMSEQKTVDFAAAASALKHSIRGDFNLVDVSDVEYAMGQESLDVRR
ncbi:MAG: sugar kinase [Acidimicrobiales bacterium]|nr:sugar kinase [Hyphomonadaceae bacterium]RZV43333.1 MAG: sugar kinase [Acidimicrobiales bacterium]